MMTSAQRIWERLLESPYKDYFLVGLEESAQRFLTEPIWRWSEAEAQVSFVAPPKETVYLNHPS